MTGLNGHQIDPMALGMTLGRLDAESDRQTEIILSQGREAQNRHRDLMKAIDRLPDRIASRMPPPQPLRSGWNMQPVIAVLQALPPLLIIALVLAAKASGALSWAEVLPFMRP